MKNLFLGSVALLLFAMAFTIVQSSCSKTEAQSNSVTITQLNKIIFGKMNPTTSNPLEVWVADYDGTNATQININLPSGVMISSELYTFSLRLSPDGQTIFFGGFNTTTNLYGIYKCNIDGSNVSLITNGVANESLRLGGAY